MFFFTAIDLQHFVINVLCMYVRQMLSHCHPRCWLLKATLAAAKRVQLTRVEGTIFRPMAKESGGEIGLQDWVEVYVPSDRAQYKEWSAVHFGPDAGLGPDTSTKLEGQPSNRGID